MDDYYTVESWVNIPLRLNKKKERFLLKLIVNGITYFNKVYE
jgi:hypothetical protein